MTGARVALDTNIAVHYLNGVQLVEDRFHAETRVALPAIVVGELLFGARNSRHRVANEIRAAKFIGDAEILEVDRTTASFYADLRLQLKAAGRPIPENDIWIAALCRQHNLVLVSCDAHFSHCSGLVAEDWTVESRCEDAG